jgi:CheY-like chemotaxis protein
VSTRTARLLIVDDDPSIREAMVDGLGEAGFIVEVASDGTAAEQRMLAAPPDLVLLDLMMPGMSGWELVERIQEHPALRRIPLAIITADQHLGRVPLGYPVWLKPLRLEQLVALIRECLQEAGGATAIRS